MPRKRTQSKKKNKRTSTKRALRTTGVDTKQDTIRAGRRGYGQGIGK